MEGDSRMDEESNNPAIPLILDKGHLVSIRYFMIRSTYSDIGAGIM